MSEMDLEPLPPEISELFAREAKAHEPLHEAMKSAALARIELAVALGVPVAPLPMAPPATATVPATGAPGSAAAGASVSVRAAGRSLAAAALCGFLAGGVIGGAIVRALTPSPEPPRSSGASIASAIASAGAPTTSVGTVASASEAAPISTASSVGAAPPPSSATAVLSASASSTSARGDLTRERELLDAAHAALGRGRAADALAIADRHATQWPRGYLSEEREVTIIQALAASGRRSEAAPRAAQFRRAHPKSLLLPVVDAAVPP